MADKRPVFKAGDIGELINALPGMFGFPPDDSLVVLGMEGSGVAFGMRLDLASLGRSKRDIAKTADLAIGHLEYQGVEGVITLAIGEPLELGRQLVLAVEERTMRVRPVAGGWATNDRFWVSMAGGDPDGYAYQRSLHHPAAVEAILEGQEISTSRRSLVKALAPIRGKRRSELEARARQVVDELLRHPVPPEDLFEAEVLPTLLDLMAGTDVSDDRMLRMAFVVTRIKARDEAWGLITPDNARDFVRVWVHVGRHVPLAWAPPAYSLASFAAWMCGDGAKAVMAAEQALAIDRQYSMAQLMLELATSGVRPSSWPWRAAS